MQANRGIAERADRTVAILVAAGISDWWNLPILLEITLWVLAVAITITVLQRVWMVRKQAMAEAAPS
jgi:CDP-diacylglycerol--glycerol-3-phosphate 3-phosphatidyltransferase/CDP-diacylglycerol--inositol 3-phosphatidyltransferase